MRWLAILAGAMLAPTLGASPALAVTVEVGQGGDTFTQANVTINPGDTVHWNWDSGYHSVTSGSPPGTANHQFDSGVQPTIGATFDQTFNHPGIYHYYCSIHYALGMVGTITVTGDDPPPTAAFTIAPLSAKAGQQVAFDASTSSTPDGDTIESYSWNFGDGTPVQTTTSPTTTHTFKSAGTPNVTLTITDSGSATSAPVSHSVTVTAPPDTAPTARFTFSPPHPTAGQTVAFDGSKSADSDTDTITGYRWSFGDGTRITTTKPKTSHRYARTGQMTVKLVVVDSRGTPSSAVSEALTVLRPPPRASGLHLSKSSFCVKKSARCRHPGTEVEFTLSRAAEVALAVRRRGQVLQRLSRAGRAGKNSISFRGKGLHPGRYTLVLTPAGGHSAQVSFTVVAS